MFSWGAFTLFLYILMRMSGFVLFSPIFSRSGVPALFRSGLIGMMSISVYFAYGGSAEVPDNLITFGFRLISEMGVGFLLSMIMRFFFYVAEQGGEMIDSQMGMSMAKTYDPSTQSQLGPVSNIFNELMLVLFFAANGHVTLLRLMLTSGEALPYGAAALGQDAALYALEVFSECAVLAIKLSLPVLGAELLGQIGMGVLMKVIPQINVFSINIELKMLIGLIMVMLLLGPMSEFLLDIEGDMLRMIRHSITLMNG